MNFSSRFTLLAGHAPFPWQEALYERFISSNENNIPESCDLPTGLGKTSVIAIWLLARAVRPERLPRRLVYVVNRRTVVDQTTTEVERLKKNLPKLNLPEDGLAVSTLRGQFADNREWSSDPSRPAVICGTVDMIGSRLLFSGYGIGYKQRPLHAGFLGQDVLLVHDEAHLEQPFQTLLRTICEEQKQCREFGRFHVMELSATSRSTGDVFELTKNELAPPAKLPDPSDELEPIHHVWRRLRARKDLALHGVKRNTVVEQIASLALARRDSRSTVLLFVRTVEEVLQLNNLLTNSKNGGVADRRVGVLTGTIRGRERDALVGQDVFKQFLSSSQPSETVYLICTSAGEVGIDISAQHMVCDLSSLDSMAQRLGRVNRRGADVSEVDIVYETDPDPKKDLRLESARWKTLEVLRRLPRSRDDDDRLNGSPLALRQLSLSPDERTAAFSPTPAILDATDILFDAWAMTTIRGLLPGRPPVEPFLHGVAEWQPPETTVAWRLDVKLLTREVLRNNGVDPGDSGKGGESDEVGELFAEYPLKPHEVLKDRSDRVFKELLTIADRHPDAPVWLMSDDGAIKILRLDLLADKNQRSRIEGRTILLSPDVGGLMPNGMLNGKTAFSPSIQYDIADDWFVDVEKKTPRRVRMRSEEQAPQPVPAMRLIREIVLRNDDDAESAPEEAIEFDPAVSGRFWRWYVRPDSADDDGSKTARYPILLNDHVAQVAQAVQRIVGNLDLPEEIRRALVRAAELHDFGKARLLWQRSIGNLTPEVPYAKSGRDRETDRLWKPLEVSKYRHEFGSLVDILHQAELHLKDLSEGMRELVLHLVAAHHGRGRPHFPTDEVFDPDPKGQDCEAIGLESALRFERLQRRYGRWGLAYLESLLRAADYEASARPTVAAEELP